MVLGQYYSEGMKPCTSLEYAVKMQILTHSANLGWSLSFRISYRLLDDVDVTGLWAIL